MKVMNVHSLLPVFKLETIDGKTVSPIDYKEKKNMLFLFFDADCSSCIDFLDSVASRYNDYKEEETEVFAIGEGPKDQLEDMLGDMNYPFPILIDKDGKVKSMFTDKTPAVFLADRFGEIRMTFIGEHLPDQDKILDNLDLYELECPECGVPSWPQGVE